LTACSQSHFPTSADWGDTYFESFGLRPRRLTGSIVDGCFVDTASTHKAVSIRRQFVLFYSFCGPTKYAALLGHSGEQGW